MILQKIVEKKKKDLEKVRKRHSLIKELTKEGIALVAEIKFASPSKGVFKEDLDPVKQTKLYQKGGANAISVVTESHFFNGSIDVIRTIRPHVNLPIIRKDFIIDEIQIYETLLSGADALLLIASILSEDRLRGLLSLSHRLGLEAVVEVHSEEDVKKAATSKARMIGINNRNLRDFSVDIKTTIDMIPKVRELIPESVVISESGISNRQDVEMLEGAGVDAILVGERLIISERPDEEIGKLLGR